ncbi:hypothetical protein F2Q69_00023375 [Brassica cretica]|uniref:Uncharacterized protein n=1 Tax=Brassica cretica TaxID=69181 RepID=A0A8S9Q7J1_BRACR|nr:hypothetical protein F2Q69_00023375 [Brassica cretica]
MVESSSGRASDHENSSHRAVEERKHRMITGGLTDEEVQSSGRDLSYQSHRSQGATLLKYLRSKQAAKEITSEQQKRQCCPST